jgi:hypothetical protein
MHPQPDGRTGGVAVRVGRAEGHGVAVLERGGAHGVLEAVDGDDAVVEPGERGGVAHHVAGRGRVDAVELDAGALAPGAERGARAAQRDDPADAVDVVEATLEGRGHLAGRVARAVGGDDGVDGVVLVERGGERDTRGRRAGRHHGDERDADEERRAGRRGAAGVAQGVR